MECSNKKIINYYEARGKKLTPPLEGGQTHYAKMYVEASIDGKSQVIEPGIESWGKSKGESEMKANEIFLKWAQENDFIFINDQD